MADQARAFLQRFTQEMSPRESATDQEKAAADYLLRELKLLGYQAQLQPFTFQRLSSGQTVRLLDGQGLPGRPLRLTGLGAAAGPLAHVGLSKAEDMPESGLAGRVALVRRGELTFQEKVSRVAEAGAVAAIIYNNVSGPFSGRLRDRASIPAVGISREDGERLLALMEDGEVEITVLAEMSTHASRNVIALRPDVSALEDVLVVGAHYDTVPATQGANDNGSGVATLMTLAAELAEVDLPFRLRLLLFGSEEVGLLGSRHYVDSLAREELDSIIAMINLDSTGSGQALENLFTISKNMIS